jgi:cysteine synthase B
MGKTLEIERGHNVQDRLTTVGRLVGNTPLYPFHRMSGQAAVCVSAKLEWLQLGHSVKTRPAFNMISQAVHRGELDLRGTRRILDASSGNTAVALAAVAGSIGLPATLVVPENISTQKLTNLRALGADIIFSSKFEGTDGAQDVARKLAAKHPGRYWYADQYNNDDNWKAHYEKTAIEIYEQTAGAVTHFVTALGTSGTLMGVGRRLKELDPGIRVIAMQPDLPMHGLEGWKHMDTARVPGIYDPKLADDNIEIETTEALEMMKRVATVEGMVISPSAAANLLGATKVAGSISEGFVVTILPDAGNNYPEVMKDIFNQAKESKYAIDDIK